MTDSIKMSIPFQALMGIVKKPLCPVSIEDMNRAIAEAGASAAKTSIERSAWPELPIDLK